MPPEYSQHGEVVESYSLTTETEAPTSERCELPAELDPMMGPLLRNFRVAAERTVSHVALNRPDC